MHSSRAPGVRAWEESTRRTTGDRGSARELGDNSVESVDEKNGPIDVNSVAKNVEVKDGKGSCNLIYPFKISYGNLLQILF